MCPEVKVGGYFNIMQRQTALLGNASSTAYMPCTPDSPGNLRLNQIWYTAPLLQVFRDLLPVGDAKTPLYF